MAGGANPYRKGAAFENRVLRLLIEAGHFGLRSPTSASPVDLLVITTHQVYFIQCKLGGYMRPAEREEVITLARRYGGVPTLAKPQGKDVTFVDLRTGGNLDEELCPSAADSSGSGGGTAS